MPLVLCQKNCDIGGCSLVFKSAFSDLLSHSLEKICRDIKEVLKCMNDCHEIFLPYFVTTNSTINFLNEICTGDFFYDITVHWECIRRHINKLLVCVATSNSLEYHKPNQNTKLLSCSKVLAMLNCPQDVLYNQCEDEAVEAVNEAFQLGLKSVLTTSCFKISNDKASNLDVQPRLDTNYSTTAICMDNYTYLAESCFNEYLEKAAHSELNSCSEGAETVCSKAFSTISCSSPLLGKNFYSSLFSFGKQVCNASPSNLHRKKTNRNINSTDIQFQENMKTMPFVKNTLPTLSHTSIEATVTPSLKEFNTTLSLPVDDIKQFNSTVHFQTPQAAVFDSDFMYSSTTIVPNSMDNGTLLSDAPQNLSKAETEGINHFSNVNDFTNSNNYHTSCGAMIFSFPCMLPVIVAFFL